MTISEEIEQLKIKLNQTVDKREQAEVLVELLDRYTSINNTDSQPYIDHLLQLSEKLDEPLYKAWGLYHLAVLKKNMAEYDVSMDTSQQCVALFEKIGNKHGIADSYNNIGILYYEQGNYPEALKNSFASLKIQEEIGNKSGIAKAYNSIGNINSNQGNYSEALKSYSASLEMQEEIGNKSGIARVYNNIGTVYYQKGNYPEALKSILASLKILLEIGDKLSIASSYHNIGILYSKLQNHLEALKNFFASLKIFKEFGNSSGIADSYISIGGIYRSQGNYPEALKNFFAALKLCEKNRDKLGIAKSYNSIGMVYSKQENHPEALKSYLAALKTQEEIHDKFGMANSYHNIGDAYLNQGNYSEALKFQLQALQISEEIGRKELIKESSLELSNVNKALGDFENALKYYEKYREVEKEILGEESTKQLNNLNFMHNLEQKEKDLEIEQLRNVELKKEKDRSENLLLNILPAEVAEELKEKGTAKAKLFENVTVLFTDFKGFTTISEKLSPQQLVDELHICFSAFDAICGKYNIEKIKTVGDAYLAVSGLPQANANHAYDMVKAAEEIRNFIAARKAEAINRETFDVRIGIHSGHVVAGIVGVKKFAYDIWGDTVNTAARMEQNSEAGKINISQTTYELVKDKFNCEYRGEIEAKNKGKLKMYFVS